MNIKKHHDKGISTMIGKFTKAVAITVTGLALSGCATIVNDPEVPLTLSFSNGESGSCSLTNTRASYQVDVPSTTNVRRSRSNINYNCQTASGRPATGSIPSSMESGKVVASVIFFDLGITDSITEKGRTYPASFVIPVQ